MHAVHQHEAPGYNLDAEHLVLAHGETEHRVNPSFATQCIQKTADAVREAVKDAQPVTDIGFGVADVEEVASNRQVLGEDGECCYIRFTSGGSDFEFARQAPEGIIDPSLYLLSFWNEEEPVASLSYYACHPQSYYRNGRVTCDFPGIARNQHEADTGVFQVHFAGCAGNVTAGKYNDGSEELRPVLAERLQAGMAAAWDATDRSSLETNHIEWDVERVELPSADELSVDSLVSEFAADHTEGSPGKLAWQRRCELGDQIEIPRLRLGDVDLVHLPGEPFIEYQLAAQTMRDDRTAIVAGYGDGGPGYIPTEAAIPLGGYEVRVNRFDGAVEDVLTDAIQQLLDANSVPKTPSDFTKEKPRASGMPTEP